MRACFSDDILKQILADDSPIAPENAEAMLSCGLSGESDRDAADACIDLLLRSRGIDAAPRTHELPVSLPAPTLEQPERLRFAVPKRFKLASAACLIIVAAVCVNTFSTLAFNYNIADEFVSWTREKITITLGGDPYSGQKPGDEVFSQIQNQLLENGIMHVAWPDYLPSGMQVDSVNVEQDADTTEVLISLKNKGDSLSIGISEYRDYGLLSEEQQVDIAGYYTNAEQRTINGVKVFFVSNDRISIAVFLDGTNKYTLSSTFAPHTLERIVTSML